MTKEERAELINNMGKQVDKGLFETAKSLTSLLLFHYCVDDVEGNEIFEEVFNQTQRNLLDKMLDDRGIGTLRKVDYGV